MNGIVTSIITNEFRNKFVEPYRNGSMGVGRCSALHTAMVVRFRLHADYNTEEGYRNLEILIWGRGSNYISVFAREDWNVISKAELPDDEDADCEYTKGQTPWVLEDHLGTAHHVTEKHLRGFLPGIGRLTWTQYYQSQRRKAKKKCREKKKL